MMKTFPAPLLIGIFFAIGVSAQTHAPSIANKPFVVRSKQQVAEISKELQKQQGNQQVDLMGSAGNQMRIAIFHDEKHENDLHEVHDWSDDIYYVLDGEAILILGGTLIEPTETSVGEWRAKSASGGQKITIKKGDLIIVPRGTPHQRTVTGKGFSMILIKVFSDTQ
jgi:mannose-6-phosphate isomerase-like protein (cupin superfamily)